MASHVLYISVLLLYVTQGVSAYFLVIDAHAEECFFDKVVTATKLGLTFEVVEGGFLDIDVKITGPDGKAIHSEERASSGKYTFAAHMDGNYHYCFGNKMSTMTPKVVMFSMDIGDAPKSDEQLKAQDSNLTNWRNRSKSCPAL